MAFSNWTSWPAIDCQPPSAGSRGCLVGAAALQFGTRQKSHGDQDLATGQGPVRVSAVQRFSIVANGTRSGKEADCLRGLKSNEMQASPRKIVLLGSTGSIGRSTIEVVLASNGELEIVA